MFRLHRNTWSDHIYSIRVCFCFCHRSEESPLWIINQTIPCKAKGQLQSHAIHPRRFSPIGKNDNQQSFLVIVCKFHGIEHLSLFIPRNHMVRRESNSLGWPRRVLGWPRRVLGWPRRALSRAHRVSVGAFTESCYCRGWVWAAAGTFLQYHIAIIWEKIFPFLFGSLPSPQNISSSSVG